MNTDSLIKSVRARQVVSEREHPGIEATVITEDGSKGVAVAAGGHSVGKYEAKFTYDGGEKWGGRGVMKAIHNINAIIGPALVGIDSTKQSLVDEVLIELDGTPDKSRLGGNVSGGWRSLCGWQCGRRPSSNVPCDRRAGHGNWMDLQGDDRRGREVRDQYVRER